MLLDEADIRVDDCIIGGIHKQEFTSAGLNGRIGKSGFDWDFFLDELAHDFAQKNMAAQSS